MSPVPIDGDTHGKLREIRDLLAEIKELSDATKPAFEHLGLGGVALEHRRLYHQIDAAHLQVGIVLDGVTEARANRFPGRRG